MKCRKFNRGTKNHIHVCDEKELDDETAEALLKSKPQFENEMRGCVPTLSDEEKHGIGLVQEYYNSCDAFDLPYEEQAVREGHRVRPQDLSLMQQNSSRVIKEISFRESITPGQLKGLIHKYRESAVMGPDPTLEEHMHDAYK